MDDDAEDAGGTHCCSAYSSEFDNRCHSESSHKGSMMNAGKVGPS